MYVFLLLLRLRHHQYTNLEANFVTLLLNTLYCYTWLQVQVRVHCLFASSVRYILSGLFLAHLYYIVDLYGNYPQERVDNLVYHRGWVQLQRFIYLLLYTYGRVSNRLCIRDIIYLGTM